MQNGAKCENLPIPYLKCYMTFELFSRCEHLFLLSRRRVVSLFLFLLTLSLSLPSLSTTTATTTTCNIIIAVPVAIINAAFFFRISSQRGYKQPFGTNQHSKLISFKQCCVRTAIYTLPICFLFASCSFLHSFDRNHKLDFSCQQTK